MDHRTWRHALHGCPFVHPDWRALDVELLALSGALCHGLWVIGLGRAGYPDIARDRRDRCNLHLPARRICGPATLDTARHAGSADVGNSLPGTPPHAGVSVHGRFSRWTDRGSGSSEPSVVAAVAGVGSVGQSPWGLRSGVGADRTDRTGSSLVHRSQQPRCARRAMGVVWCCRRCSMLLHAVWLEHAVRCGEDSQSGHSCCH